MLWRAKQFARDLGQSAVILNRQALMPNMAAKH
jgi:hypothetical protein